MIKQNIGMNFVNIIMFQLNPIVLNVDETKTDAAVKYYTTQSESLEESEIFF